MIFYHSSLYAMDITGITNLAKDINDITWVMLSTDNYRLTEEQANYYTKLAYLEADLQDLIALPACNSPLNLNSDKEKRKYDPKIILLVEKSKTPEETENPYTLDRYNPIMRAKNVNQIYPKIFTFDGLLAVYKQEMPNEPLDESSSAKAAIQLREYLLSEYFLEVHEKILQENLVIHAMKKNPQDWQMILKKLKDTNTFNFTDYNHLVARLSQEFLLNLKADQNVKNIKKISPAQLLSSAVKRTSIGSYQDLAKTQAAFFEALGIDSYVAYYDSPYGKHATTFSINPSDPAHVVSYNYDSVNKISDKPSLPDKQNTSPTKSTSDIKFYDSKNNLLTSIPAQLNSNIELLKKRPEQSYGSPSFEISKVTLKAGDKNLADLFEAGKNTFGLSRPSTPDPTIIKRVSTTLFNTKGPVGAAAVQIESKPVQDTPSYDSDLSSEESTSKQLKSLVDAKILFPVELPFGWEAEGKVAAKISSDFGSNSDLENSILKVPKGKISPGFTIYGDKEFTEEVKTKFKVSLFGEHDLDNFSGVIEGTANTEVKVGVQENVSLNVSGRLSDDGGKVGAGVDYRLPSGVIWFLKVSGMLFDKELEYVAGLKQCVYIYGKCINVEVTFKDDSKAIIGGVSAKVKF